jgi:hypothetical protein
MRITLIALTATALLGGCGTTDPDTRKAGKWTTEVELVRLDIAGAPKGAEKQIEAMKAQMASQMKAQLGREECVSSEQASKEDVSRDFLKGMSTGGDCKLTTDKVGGGNMDIASTCTMGPSKMDITMKGTNSSEKIDAVVTMKGGAPGGGPQIDLEMKVGAKYVGDC